MKSWKIGAIAGLIAGIIAGILKVVSIILFSQIGLPYLLPSARLYYISKIATVEILMAIVWGIVLGVVYIRARHVMPENTILKGLIYGLVFFLIISLRDAFWLVQYVWIIFIGYVMLLLVAYVIFNFIAWISFGLVLVILYESWYKKEKRKIKIYDMKGGIIPGAIAGLIGGIVATSSDQLLTIIGFWGVPGQLTDIMFTLSMMGAHIFIHIVWGVIFGIIFTKVYNLVPGKGILKGLYYSLLILIITTLYIMVFWGTFGLILNDPGASAWSVAYIIDIPAIIAFGIVIGALYKHPK